MQTLEAKKITIKIPQIRPKFIAIFLTLAFCAALFFYWYQNIHPYMTLSNAHVNAYSTLVSCDTSGRIVEIGPHEGDSVKKGDLLFSFDRERLFAKQTGMKTSLSALETQIEFEKGRIVKAMEGYLAAINELELGVGNGEDVQRQLGLMENAQNKSEEAVSKASAIKTELGLFENELKKGAFFAPFNGVILKRYKNEGAVITFGDPVYSLCDPDRLWIEAEIPELQIHKIAIGTPARVKVGAYPNKKFIGKVSYIGTATVAKSDHLPLIHQKGTVPIKITLENSDSSLKPGLSAKVDLKIH